MFGLDKMALFYVTAILIVIILVMMIVVVAGISRINKTLTANGISTKEMWGPVPIGGWFRKMGNSTKNMASKANSMVNPFAAKTVIPPDEQPPINNVVAPILASEKQKNDVLADHRVNGEIF